MSDIYQRIWDADQNGNGVQAITENGQGDPARGFVRVHAGPASPDLRVLSEVVIPDDKVKTYELAKALFDNYALAEPSDETETQEERTEVHELLQAIVDTPPMMVAREFIEASTGGTISNERWYSTLLELWFRRFAAGGDPALSGFEHVFVGEQQRGKVQGYHFWYKYYLDDGFARAIDQNAFPGLRDDRIEYLRSEASAGQGAFPESVTMAFKWKAPDYDAKAVRTLTKPKGGFFVGCSVEGLMALGAVRAHVTALAPKEAVISGARYDLQVYRSPDNKNIRTFYPVFLGEASGKPIPANPPVMPAVGSSAVRVVSALVNPKGTDEGRETITLVNTGNKSVTLDGWRLYDKNRRHFEITDLTLAAGTAKTLTLPANALQLSNQGGEIRLVDVTGKTVHRVSYSKKQASREGETILF